MLWPRFWSISTCKNNPKQLENSLHNVLNMVKILQVWKKYTRLYIQSSKAYGMYFRIPLSLKYLQRLSFRNSWLSSTNISDPKAVYLLQIKKVLSSCYFSILPLSSSTIASADWENGCDNNSYIDNSRSKSL